ncbi:MAG: restriction endonuclease [Clostridia bacterium]|nr:restriction endonuclease [Clostridia bacterium]
MKTIIYVLKSLFFAFGFFFLVIIGIGFLFPEIDSDSAFLLSIVISIVCGFAVAFSVEMRFGEYGSYRLLEREIKLKAKEEALDALAVKNEEALKKAQNDIQTICSSSLRTAPWLSEMYADRLHAMDMDLTSYLVHKDRPAFKAAEITRKIASEKRAAIKQLKLLQYQLRVYESVAPWLEDFKDVDSETIASCIAGNDASAPESEYDTVKRWLSKDEYENLSSAAKYQLALDRYKRSQKSRWEIGRDYERYIGYLYEIRGRSVEYFGANKGLEDMGRDLIVHQDDTDNDAFDAVIQCKYWNENRTIHEKHIFQLYGTSIMYCIEHKINRVAKIFISTAPLSETAKQAADMLGIDVVSIPYQKDYPCIKCNINSSTGQKIYHLPFDQQYDHVRINLELGELYVKTVAEAESLGFRRAKRWTGKP